MRNKIMRTTLLTPMLLALLLVAGVDAFGQINASALYHITAKHSGMCLAVEGDNSSVNNGVGVIQSGCVDTADNQKWQILPIGFGYYKIVAKHSGKALETRGGLNALDNRVAVQQWEYVSAANQQWWLSPVEDGFYRIVARHSGRSLDVNAGPGVTGNGAQVQQWDYLGGDNQKWRLIELPITVKGTLTYSDSETESGQFGTFNRPIVGCRVEVWRAGRPARTTATNNEGTFSVAVPPMPDGTDTTVLIYASNAAAQVLAGLGPYIVRRTTLSQGNTTVDFSENFATSETIRSFNAAHDIRLAHDFANARRDPQEQEVIPVVDISFNELGGLMTHYNAAAGGLVLNREHEVRDLVIMHEYAHFLEDKIGSFLLLPSYHDTCFTTQRCLNPADCANLPLTSMTQLVNSPENAWMEGFADYFAMAVKRANPSERFNLTTGGTMSESELNDPGTCEAVGRTAFDGRTINGEMIEKFVASVLWAASTPPGSDTAVFQIFDRELDLSTTHALPNIQLFHDAWVARGLGGARIDGILTARHIPSVATHTSSMHSGLTARNDATLSPAVATTPTIASTTGKDGGIPVEVLACKNTLRSGTISWGAGTSWASVNIDNLCNGTRNATSTISCFQSKVGALGWAAAIDTCR